MPEFPLLDLPATRDAAFARARAFAPHMGAEYGHKRNHVVPGHPHVSRLAAAVRVRLISEDELAKIALEEHGNLSSCFKFVQEIHWRSYWRSWLELRPKVWSQYEENRAQIEENLDSKQRKTIEFTERGESGVGAMDLFAHELIETGYLHNHARMWFAAFWIHTQNLPWQLGADFFERHLACACPASNTLSWRWVAGLQTQGKTYLARRSNLEKYCDPFYLDDGNGLEKLEKPHSAAVPPEDAPPARVPDFQLEVGDSDEPTGIWISEDDLAPETSILASVAAKCSLVSLVKTPREERSNGIRDNYRRQAIADAAARAKVAWNAPGETVEVADSLELASRIEEWARENELRRVVALKPFVGPSGDALAELEKSLSEAGIELILVRRAEDARLLPAANSGYFKFWKAIETG
ncbi:MAG TPA: FAD-binding domain-containing protein [Abditibacterium sp.]|jgi:hypothetical protein